MGELTKISQKLARAFGAAKILVKEPKALSLSNLPFKWQFDTENRINVLNRILKLYPQSRYLEIGCFRDACFSKIVADTKVGVDPMSGGTLRMTSDAFFADYPDHFDVIFVDGLHTYEQSRKDALNALHRVPVGGAVLFHDMIPLNWRSARPERVAYRWNGDVWKTAVELSMGRGFDFHIIAADHGVGFAVKTSEDIFYPDLYEGLEMANFRDYLGLIKAIHVVDYKDAMQAIDAHGVNGLQKIRKPLTVETN